MSNYCGFARSNYFRVKDPAALRGALESVPDIEVVEDAEGRLSLLAKEDGWPCEHPQTGESEDFDFTRFISPHLQDGEVAVFVEVGAFVGVGQGVNSVLGYAHAINNRGELRVVQLGDIYALGEMLGPNLTRAEPA